MEKILPDSLLESFCNFQEKSPVEKKVYQFNQVLKQIDKIVVQLSKNQIKQFFDEILDHLEELNKKYQIEYDIYIVNTDQSCQQNSNKEQFEKEDRFQRIFSSIGYNYEYMSFQQFVKLKKGQQDVGQYSVQYYQNKCPEEKDQSLNPSILCSKQRIESKQQRQHDLVAQNKRIKIYSELMERNLQNSQDQKQKCQEQIQKLEKIIKQLQAKLQIKDLAIGQLKENISKYSTAFQQVKGDILAQTQSQIEFYKQLTQKYSYTAPQKLAERIEQLQTELKNRKNFELQKKNQLIRMQEQYETQINTKLLSIQAFINQLRQKSEFYQNLQKENKRLNSRLNTQKEISRMFAQRISKIQSLNIISH